MEIERDPPTRLGASLPEAHVRSFDDALADLLRVRFHDDPLAVPHRVWALIGRKAG